MKYVKLFCVVLCIVVLLAACKKECTHQYQSQITQQASCTQEGEEIFTCTLCEHSYTQPVPMTEHHYGPMEVEKAATCAEEGLQASHCSVCGATESAPIEKTAHILENITVIKEPNCTEEGQGCGDCTVCGAKQVTEAIATNGVHVFTNTVIREATCTEMGEGSNTCQLCQYTESCQYQIKDHDYSIQNVLTKVGCTQNGEIEHVCAGCGTSFKETVEAPGHTWTGGTCMTRAVCSTCGITGSTTYHLYDIVEEQKISETFAGYRAMKCNVCGATREEYYTKYHTYDLNAIAAEIAAYARQKGFRTQIGHVPNNASSVRTANFPVWLPASSQWGPQAFVERGKEHVDHIYSELTSNSSVLGDRIMHISVSYVQSGALGGGAFYIKCGTTFYA